MTASSVSIGNLSGRTRCKVQTIRWYEEGRPVAAGRARLNFIRHARELGFPLDVVHAPLALIARPDRRCEEAHALASAQRALVQDKLRRLNALQVELARMTDACGGGVAGECRILETFADHRYGYCANPDRRREHAGRKIWSAGL